MARIRTIKPEFWADEKLSLLDPVARLVFLGLISMADDAGRLVDNVKQLDGQIFPNTDDTCREALDTLARMGRVLRYRAKSGQSIIQLSKWTDHQKVDKPSKHVLPGPDMAALTQPSQVVAAQAPSIVVATPSANPRGILATDSRDSRAPTLDLGPRTLDLGPTTNDLLDAAAREEQPRQQLREQPPEPHPLEQPTEPPRLQLLTDDTAQVYAISMSTALNAAITRRWGEQINPVTYATGLPLAVELIKSNVELELARLAIGSVCAASKLPRPPNSLAYFRNAILDAHRAAEQRLLNEADAGATAKRGGAPSPMASLVNADADRERASVADQRAQAFETARRNAAVAWGKDPKNAPRFREITATVNATYGEIVKSKFLEKARTVDILAACAAEAGFPSIDDWTPPPASVTG